VDVCHMVQLQTQRDFPDIELKVDKTTMVGKEKTETISSRFKKENRRGEIQPTLAIHYSSTALSSARRIPKLKLLGFTGLLAIIEARRSGVSPANGF
jgi:TnpA family transposase